MLITEGPVPAGNAEYAAKFAALPKVSLIPPTPPSASSLMLSLLIAVLKILLFFKKLVPPFVN